jgi:hypothetical protein
MTNRTGISLDALSRMFLQNVASTTDLVHLGITSATVKRRCVPGGPWQQLLPGILLLSGRTPTRKQLMQAALRYTSDSMLTGHDALALHGVRSAVPGRRVHLLVPRTRFVRSNSDILVERTLSPPRPVLRQGLLAAPLARAAVDAARQMTTHASVTALFSEVVFVHDVRLDELHTELVLGKRRGASLAEQVLHEIGTRIRSGVASSAEALVLRAGLPPPRWNVPIDDTNGNSLGTVTGTWDDAKLAWDVHAFEYDPTPASYPRALKRGSRLASSGLLVLHTPAARIRSEPDAVVAELRSAYEQAQLRTA